jgi:predicted nuclease of predicted toxin-antitoxin system
LSQAGIHAVHWSSVGAATAPDTEILLHAQSQDYVVLTCDLDCSTILAITNGAKPSVVQIRSDNVSVNAIGVLVVSALKQMKAELAQGALITIDPKRARVRMLPLRSTP